LAEKIARRKGCPFCVLPTVRRRQGIVVREMPPPQAKVAQGATAGFAGRFFQGA
jgi:hypothetical protein